MCILILVLLKEKSDRHDHRWPVVLAGRKRGDRAPRHHDWRSLRSSRRRTSHPGSGGLFVLSRIRRCVQYSLDLPGVPRPSQRCCKRPDGLGAAQGRPYRGLGSEPAGMAALRDGCSQGGPGAGDGESGAAGARSGIHLEQDGWRPTLFQEMVADGRQVSEEERSARQASVKPRDPAQIQYTSGTTGFPKGAILHHHGILNNAMLFAQRWGLRQSDRYCNPMPLFHTAGCVVAVLGSLYTGSTLHPLLAFDPAKALQIIGHEGCTTLVAVPTMLLAMLQHPDFATYDLASLSRVGTGGTPVPVYLMEQVKERMGADVGIVFGQTETSPIITQTLPSDPFDLKAATVGIPLPHTEVKVIHPATGEVVPCGERGELCCRGYLVMVGYYHMPEKTAQAIDARGGCTRPTWRRWMLTGMSTSWAGSKTWSFAAAKTSSRRRSRSS